MKPKPMSRTPEYHTWCSIKDRCYNPKMDSYQYYGAKGVTMCDEWLQDFGAFIAYMGPRPSNHHSIERLDNSKGYGPGNCIWATAKAQRLNQEKRVIWVIVNGVKKCLKDAAVEAGVKYHTAYRRYRVGWTLEECLRPV